MHALAGTQPQSWQAEPGHRWIAPVGDPAQGHLLVVESPRADLFAWSLDRDDRRLDAGDAPSLEAAQADAEEAWQWYVEHGEV